MKTIASLALLFTAFAPSIASADALKDSATKVFAERKTNVVRLTVTRKISEKDRVFEVTATSYDGKGTLVTALGRLEGGQKGELVRVAMFQEDGSEVEGDLVLTDPKLDLAFIKLRLGEEGADAPVFPAAVPLASDKVALLDDLIGITRYGAGFQREASVALIEVAAIIETPRLLFLPSAGLPDGAAAFNTKGELVGMMARVDRQPVLVPAAAIQKLAETIKPEEK